MVGTVRVARGSTIRADRSSRVEASRQPQNLVQNFVLFTTSETFRTFAMARVNLCRLR